MLEVESLLGIPNGETDLSSVGIDDGFDYAEEWSSQNEDFLFGAPNIANNMFVSIVPTISAMVCSDSPLEKLLYGKNIKYPIRQVRRTQLMELIRINPITLLYTLFQISS